MERDDNNKLKSLYFAWSDRVERALARWIMLLIILLVVFQMVLQFPAARHLLTTTDYSEGVPVNYAAH
jgi:hypothetical protein